MSLRSTQLVGFGVRSGPSGDPPSPSGGSGAPFGVYNRRNGAPNFNDTEKYTWSSNAISNSTTLSGLTGNIGGVYTAERSATHAFFAQNEHSTDLGSSAIDKLANADESRAACTALTAVVEEAAFAGNIVQGYLFGGDVGGSSSHDTQIERFVWASEASAVLSAVLSVAKRDNSNADYANGKIYGFGGHNGFSNACTTDVNVFNTSSETSETSLTLGQAIAGGTAASDGNNTMISAGGRTSAGADVTTVTEANVSAATLTGTTALEVADSNACGMNNITDGEALFTKWITLTTSNSRLWTWASDSWSFSTAPSTGGTSIGAC